MIHEAKKGFFEYQQTQIETKLEILDKITDEDLINLANNEKSHDEKQSDINQYFIKLGEMTDLLSSYFEKILFQLENDIPEIKDGEQNNKMGQELKKDKTIYESVEDESSSHWNCRVCTFANEKSVNVCIMCGAERN